MFEGSYESRPISSGDFGIKRIKENVLVLLEAEIQNLFLRPFFCEIATAKEGAEI